MIIPIITNDGYIGIAIPVVVDGQMKLYWVKKYKAFWMPQYDWNKLLPPPSNHDKQ